MCQGKTRDDLESGFASQLRLDEKPNVGEAAVYDIYYDDTEYDYMQHLRPIGVKEEGVDSVLLEVPSSSNNKAKKREALEIKLKQPVSLVPTEVLPSNNEYTLEETYEASRAIPSALAGFQPDMNLHLRQTLEALEDDAFVDDGLGDDFFGELVKDGERSGAEDPGFEFYEEGEGGREDTELSASQSFPSQGEESWEARFSKFKKQQQLAAAIAAKLDSDDGSDVEREDQRSEAQDTVGTLPRLPVIGGKRRRKGASDASGYSLTSSSMYRNEGLTTLDERFAKVRVPSCSLLEVPLYC